MCYLVLRGSDDSEDRERRGRFGLRKKRFQARHGKQKKRIFRMAFVTLASIGIVGLSLDFWFDSDRIVWAAGGIVSGASQSSDGDWHVLVTVYDGYNDIVALNGPGVKGSGNYCWRNGDGCSSSPLGFHINQTLTVESLYDGTYRVFPR